MTSNNTFTIIANPAAVDFSKLRWVLSKTPAAPVANPGPNQTVPAGTMVTLDGRGSTNPSGIGALDYMWTLTSRPPGTRVTFRYVTTPVIQFPADVPGAYVFTLTVTNGLLSSSKTVTITAQ